MHEVQQPFNPISSSPPFERLNMGEYFVAISNKFLEVGCVADSILDGKLEVQHGILS